MSPSIEVGTRITHVPAAIHAAGGSLVVVTASIPTVILFSESGGWFRRTLMLISLGISAAAVSLGLVRAAFVVQQERAGSPGDRRERGVPSPGGETAALIFIALVSALVVWFVLPPSGSCDHLPYGSERTACSWEVAMGGLLLVWLATVAWVLASLVLGATWVVRTWNDIRRLRSSG